MKNLITILCLFLFWSSCCNPTEIEQIDGCNNPTSCTYDPDVNNYVHGTCLYIDSCGECGGDNLTCTDECGVVNGDNSTCIYECGVVNGDNSTCIDECGIVNGANADMDCYGVCGGGALMDCYGVCGGGALLDECFSYNESSQIAYYFFDSITISGSLINSDDWVAAFNGDVCVGSKQWLCSGNCELQIYGYSALNELTEGYMLSGDIPTFKIYDTSNRTFYDATPSEEILWQEGDFNEIETLIAE